MNRRLSFFALVFISFSALPYPAFPAPSGTADSTVPETFHRFLSKTVWGELNVLIKDFHDHFIVEIHSDALVSGWILKEESTSRTVSKGGLHPKEQFEFNVNKPYNAAYRLTLFLNADHQEVPTVIHLSSGSEHAIVSPVPETVEDFEPSAHHSYNDMVKNLYAEAVQEYSKGKYREAFTLLLKAEELDPHQPQVRSLKKQAQANLLDAEEPDLLKKAKREYKKGNKEAALAKIADYLDQNPDDPDALDLKNSIEGRDTDNISHPKKPPKVKKTEPSEDHVTNDPRHSQLDEQTQQAKADQAYNLGLESYRKGDYSASKKFWEETLQISPTHLQAKRNLERLKRDHPDLP